MGHGTTTHHHQTNNHKKMKTITRSLRKQARSSGFTSAMRHLKTAAHRKHRRRTRRLLRQRVSDETAALETPAPCIP
jgi:hypothetical protein